MDRRLLALAEAYRAKYGPARPDDAALRGLYWRAKAAHPSGEARQETAPQASRLQQVTDIVGALPLPSFVTFPANVLAQGIERHAAERRALETLQADMARLRAVRGDME